jgi:hypothetical protein
MAIITIIVVKAGKIRVSGIMTLWFICQIFQVRRHPPCYKMENILTKINATCQTLMIKGT